VGSILVPLTNFPVFHFIKSFQLTPELLFYVFLPVLIFESAYNMNMREMAENVRSISWLSVVSLVISTFFVAGALYFGLALLGFPVPFMATLIFGALISATDPVAVLALFKEFGVPRRLSLIFEGESLFNDGTSLALFLIILEVAMAGFTGFGTIFEGVFMFTSMVVGGIIFGLFMGFIFSKLISKVKDNEHIEITLTMLVAHLTFILSELISHHLVLFGQEIKFSSIIATVMASMVIGNYGRFKISPRVEEYMEKFWGYFAFVANSMVFILMGLLFADLPIRFDQFIVPMILTVVIVMLGRALSIYPVVALVNWQKKEAPIPMTWQHLLAWGSLRGALAVTMVLLIPDTFTLPGWSYDFTVKEFIAAITIGCIYFTLCIKATTIGAMIKKMKLSDLTALETLEYHECSALIYQEALDKLEDFHEKGYVKDDVFHRLKLEYTERAERSGAACKALFDQTPGDMSRALQMYALGMEKRFLRELFIYQEVSESEYKEILNKIAIQTSRVEEGREQVSGHAERFEQDWFETLVLWFRKKFRPKTTKQETLEEYRYYRAQEVVLAKVLRRLKSLGQRSPGLYGDAESSDSVVALYESLRVDAERKRDAAGARIGTELAFMNESFGRAALFKTEERMLEELLENSMLPPKVANMLYNELKDEAYSIM
jgi:CPA1 family monovalent cation:H+ antiporter